jgi:hypothetical protein
MKLARSPWITMAVYDPASGRRAYRFFQSMAQAERKAATLQIERPDAVIVMSFEVAVSRETLVRREA